MTQTRRLLALLVPLLAAMSVSCGAAPSADQEPVLVFAAASLTDAFEAIATTFEAGRTEFNVHLNLAGSSSLREQILEGAPADVFVSANIFNMDQVIEAGEAASSATLARNLLQIAVPAGNPAGVTGLADFAREDLLIGLCAEGVPCGDFGRRALANAGVTVSIDTNEPDVRALLVKIEAGELDAGIVYATDVLAAGDRVEGVVIAADANVVATYLIAALTNAPNSDGADAFVTFAVSDEARAILARYGFSTP
ncbi:MAG TPA: molybdate ABC transporter substrate-binding protein [Acidimicrobiia bacterium]|nr:molybdate ABC transporter substrate-binding protein [Acidimicrobiia bacterium]